MKTKLQHNMSSLCIQTYVAHTARKLIQWAPPGTTNGQQNSNLCERVQLIPTINTPVVLLWMSSRNTLEGIAPVHCGDPCVPTPHTHVLGELGVAILGGRHVVGVVTTS